MYAYIHVCLCIKCRVSGWVGGWVGGGRMGGRRALDNTKRHGYLTCQPNFSVAIATINECSHIGSLDKPASVTVL